MDRMVRKSSELKYHEAHCYPALIHHQQPRSTRTEEPRRRQYHLGIVGVAEEDCSTVRHWG